MRKKKWIRHTSRLLGMRLLAAAITFLLLLAAFGYMTMLVAENRPYLSGLGYFNWSNEVICAAIVANVVVSYLGARLVFYASSFTRNIESTEYCSKCYYNLTGNESGVCPECGTRQFRLCGKCGYDLTGNESGRCPECGSTGEIEFPAHSLFFAGSRTLKWILAGFLLLELSMLVGVLQIVFNIALLFLAFRFGSMVYYVSFLATIISIPIIAICCIKTTKSRLARYLSVVVLVCWIIMTAATLMSSWLASLFTGLDPVKSMLLQTPWMATIVGLHFIAAILCAKIPSKWCARGLAMGGIWYVVMQFTFAWTFIMRPGGFPGVSSILVIYAIPLSYTALTAASIGIASFKIWNLIPWRVHYERTGEWPRY